MRASKNYNTKLEKGELRPAILTRMNFIQVRSLHTLHALWEANGAFRTISGFNGTRFLLLLLLFLVLLSIRNRSKSNLRMSWAKGNFLKTIVASSDDEVTNRDVWSPYQNKIFFSLHCQTTLFRSSRPEFPRKTAMMFSQSLFYGPLTTPAVTPHVVYEQILGWQGKEPR